jgi:hypothetical protein
MYVRSMTTAASTGDPGHRDVALLGRMVDVDRQMARLEAKLAEAIVEFLDLRRDEPVDAVATDKGKVLAGEFAADEIAAALGWSTHRVHARAWMARRLRTDCRKSGRCGDMD